MSHRKHDRSAIMHSHDPTPRANRLLLWAAWSVALLCIPLLSILGRPLQYWVAETVGYSVAAWVIGLALLLCIGLLLVYARNLRLTIPLLHLVWFMAVFLVLPLFLERVEERLHFLTFGLFGALSMLLFRPWLALVLCLLLSGADELLQYFLADRVGDWRDVAMNSLASVCAAAFVWLTMLRRMAADSPPMRSG